MPEIRNFIVTQTRSVQVKANTAVDASRIAAAAFANGQTSTKVIDGPEDIYGNTVNRIQETNLEIKAL